SVAFFILFLIWGPKPKAVTLSNVKLVIAGGVTTIISAFVGATGPLVASFVHRQNMDKLPTVATFSACMSFQHMLKAMVFLTVGFAFQDWFFVIVLMIISGAVGTWVGLHLLKSLSADLFKQLFSWVVTALALRLCWQVFF
uniref:TSUP family transporter n=1 Tax=Neptunomonas sp. TaxID=1971898 RepID=UPI0035698903